MQEQNIAQMLENPFMQYNHIEIVSVNFIHNVKAGHLTARGRTVSRRRHICVVAVEITDETDTLLFSSTFSMYCISAEG